MGYIITLVAILVIAVIMTYVVSSPEGREANMLFTFCLTGFLSILFITIPMGASYHEWLSLKEDEVKVHQYADEVNLYTEMGVNSMVLGQLASKEITDLKFSDYQKEMSHKIECLRKKVNDYNDNLITKRNMKKNWYFGAVIYMPPESEQMKTVDMLKLMEKKGDYAAEPIPEVPILETPKKKYHFIPPSSQNDSFNTPPPKFGAVFGSSI